MQTKKRSAIALLVTVLFVMAITVGIGIGLKDMKNASKDVEDERFMFQSAVVLEDVLSLLKSSLELEELSEASAIEEFASFLSQTQLIPLEVGDMKVFVKTLSARGKFNINALQDSNATLHAQRADALQAYLQKSRINPEYTAFLRDAMGGIKEDASYNTRMFYEKPYLYRDYVASLKHLWQINDAYMQQYHDASIKNVNFKELFLFHKGRNAKIDLNYATPSTWMLLLGIDEESANVLTKKTHLYSSYEDLPILDEKKALLQAGVFETSFFEPYVDVEVTMKQGDKTAKILFEYDIKNKKGSNFVYEI